MYRIVELPPTPPENFALPFEGKLSQDNRWIIMANLIPWEEFEKEYGNCSPQVSSFIDKGEGKTRILVYISIYDFNCHR